MEAGGEVEGAQRLGPGEPGGLDPALGAAARTVVAFGHEQLGEEAAVGHLLAGGGGGGGVGEVGGTGRGRWAGAACGREFLNWLTA